MFVARAALGASLLPSFPRHSTMPITGFCLLSAAEVCGLLFMSVGPARPFIFLRYPPLAVHVCALIYYLSEDDIPVMVDVFGRELHPLRYVLWIISVSQMSLSIYYVVASILAKRAAGMIPTSAKRKEELHALIVRTLYSVLACFGFGFLASWINLCGPSPSFDAVGPACVASPLRMLPNALGFALSCAAFYHMLGARRVAHEAETSPSRHSGRPTVPPRPVGVVVVWHIFVVWLMAASWVDGRRSATSTCSRPDRWFCCSLSVTPTSEMAVAHISRGAQSHAPEGTGRQAYIHTIFIFCFYRDEIDDRHTPRESVRGAGGKKKE